jgi:hypothetical protein
MTDQQDSEEYTTEEAAAVLYRSNEARVKELEETTNGQVSLENAFDALKMIVLLEHIARATGCFEPAAFVFEAKRAEMLTKIEATVADMREARDAAQRQAVLTGGPGIPPPGAGPRIIRGGRG